MKKTINVEKLVWKPGTMLNPVPVVMVSCGDVNGKKNIITIAWTGTICSDPPMLSISIRKHRFSYSIIRESGKFAVNLVSVPLAKIADWCGVRSGKDYDKFEFNNLTARKANTSNVPLIEESPINIECTVTQVIELGSHDLFLAKIDCVDVDSALLNDNGALDLQKAHLTAYSHGVYHELGNALGKFGFSVKNEKKRKK